MKTRLDIYLTEKGFFESREKARAAIMEGLVYVDGRISDKPGTPVKDDAVVTVKGDTCPYVSRGGLKLEKALDAFKIDMTALTAIDIGSSTGGFTDCMLQRGAAKVYAVDVGTNQLDYRLRTDPRVVCMEKTNFRYFDLSLINEKLDFACTDVSFISLRHIFPNAFELLKEGGDMVCLIKPQFEAGRDEVGKNGIIRDPLIHKKVIENVISYAVDTGFDICELDFSPVKGGKGNIEFLAHLKKEVHHHAFDAAVIEKTVSAAHNSLDDQR